MNWQNTLTIHLHCDLRYDFRYIIIIAVDSRECSYNKGARSAPNILVYIKIHINLSSRKQNTCLYVISFYWFCQSILSRVFEWNLIHDMPMETTWHQADKQIWTCRGKQFLKKLFKTKRILFKKNFYGKFARIRIFITHSWFGHTVRRRVGLRIALRFFY